MTDQPGIPMSLWANDASRRAAYELMSGYVAGNAANAHEHGYDRDARALSTLATVLRAMGTMDPQTITRDTLLAAANARGPND